jgi:hypothetical protein
VHRTTDLRRANAQADLFEVIEVFDNWRRRHCTLGYRSPVRILEDGIRKHGDQQPKVA